MKRNLFFLLVMLLLSGSMATARDTYADLSKANWGGNATWAKVADSDSYTFAWSTGTDRYVSFFEAFGGTAGGTLDWSEGVQLVFQPANTSTLQTANKGYNVTIVTLNGSFSRWMSYRDTKKELTLTANEGEGFKKNGITYITPEDLRNVTDVRLVGDEYDLDLSVDISGLYVQTSPRASLVFDKNGNASIDLSKVDVSGTGVSYDAATHTVTATEASGQINIVFDRTYDFTNMQSGAITYSGGDIINSTVFNGSGHGGFYTSRYAPTFAGEVANGNYKTVTGITMNINAAGSMTLDGISFVANRMQVNNPHCTPVESLDHYTINADGTVTQTGAIASNYGAEADQALGDGSSNMDDYVDLDGFDELRIYTSDNARVFCVNEDIVSGTSGKAGSTAYLTGDTYFKYNETEGYYYAAVSDIKAANNGHAKVIGVKGSSWGVQLTVSKIIAYKSDIEYTADYIISGQYSPEVSLEEVGNSEATFIDCTNLTGSGISIASKNPNCLVKTSKEGLLTNAHNVIVNDQIASLVLTDGYTFKTPSLSGITAASASYSRAMANQYGTIVLPFAASANETVKFYAVKEKQGSVLIIEEAATLEAGTPAIMERLADNVVITAADAALSSEISPVEGAVTMYGSYTQDNKITEANAYYIKDNKFYQRAHGADDAHFFCDAFRAYFTIDDAASQAKAFTLVEWDGNATAVDGVAGQQPSEIEAVYSTNGTRLQSLRKGINIIRYGNGKTQSVIVK